MVGISGREDVLVDVCLVGYDEPEAAEKGGHGAGVGAAQEPGMDHAGGHDDHGAGGQELLSLADGASPVICLMQSGESPALVAACFQRSSWSLARALAG